jgi:PGF-pre-PGF domain-containing protein
LSLSALPSGAGSIIFSGNTYQNGTISVSQGNYSIVAVPANGFQFLSWQSSGGISLQANANPTNATISSSGSVAALFVPVITFTRAGNYTVGDVFAVNKHARIKIPMSSTLHGIEITFNNNNVQPFAMNVAISNPTNSNFYKVININESYTGIDNYISQVVYNFSVPVSFVKEHGISNGNIRLFKQVGNAFVPLPTTYTGTNGTYYFYSAVSNSLSLYAIGYTSNSITGTSTSLSVILPSGYSTYFFAYGGVSGKAGSVSGSKFTDNWITITNYTLSGHGRTQYNMTNIGYNTIPTGTVSGGTAPINVSLVGFAVNGIYANSQVFKTSTSGTSNTLSFTVTTSNSFVVLLYASGGAAFSATPTTSAPGNTLLQSVTKGSTSAAIIAVNSLAAGSYSASASTATTSSLSIVAIVIPPYNVIFNDSPTTATITTAGQTLSNGAMLQIVGTNTITANLPTTGNWVFNSWSVSNSLNLSIADTLASSTSLTVMGNGIVTATWNGITKFYETGLPSGAMWNVTYDGILNSSTTNTIVFSTLPGTYSFTIPVQKINGVAYEPSPSSGSLYSGNAIAITFTPFSVSISPPSNAVVDAGQYETFTATVYNGISPYTYNILVVNSITPSVIAHNDLVSGSSATTLTYTFQTTSADVSNSPEEANVVVTDSFPATVNSIYSSTFTINPAMTTPSISPTSPATYSPGSTVTFSTSFTGGTPPYTYNWLVVNSITGALLANALYTDVSATSNSFAWTIPSADNGNTVVANVIVTDSASTPVTVNSTKSAVITISSATCTISLGTTAINFGSLNPGANIATTNAITDSNTGTANAYMYVYGGNWIYSSNPAISFYVANTVWSNNANTAYSSATRLSNLATNTTILVPAGGSNTIYFGLAVPGGAPVGAYTQNIVIANQC